MNFLDLLKNKRDMFRARNTNDPQLQAFYEYYDPSITGRQVAPDIQVESSWENRERKVEGDPYLEFSGMPSFGGGQGTHDNPLMAAMGAVGVTGFRGGSAPINQQTSTGIERYLTGPMAGITTKNVEMYNNNQLSNNTSITTDKGTYDMSKQPKWWDWKYRTQ